MLSCLLRSSFITFVFALFLAQQAGAWQAVAIRRPPPSRQRQERSQPLPWRRPDRLVAVATQKPRTGRRPFKIAVNEVIVPVTVTDEKGRFVSDLDKNDFQIYEDNKPQEMSSSRANATSRW